MSTSVVALLVLLRSVLRSRVDLQVESLALRHQIGVLQRSRKRRPKITTMGQLLWTSLHMARLALGISHRQTGNGCGLASHGLSVVWSWKVRRGQPGRPAIARETRDLIRRMSRENSTWGAPRIHGELLKLGLDIGESSVSKYLVRCRTPPSQTCAVS
jgi:putative transposase